jgi:hypothetical protein
MAIPRPTDGGSPPSSLAAARALVKLMIAYDIRENFSVEVSDAHLDENGAHRLSGIT